jgi:hypothetical protein
MKSTLENGPVKLTILKGKGFSHEEKRINAKKKKKNQEEINRESFHLNMIST